MIGQGRQDQGRVICDCDMRRNVWPVDVVHQEEHFQLTRSETGVSQYRPVSGTPARIFLGEGLADRLGIEKGDVVTLLSPLRGVDNKMLGPFGMAPSSARFTVAGVLQTGFHEYDTRLAIVSGRAAQRMLNRGDVVQWLDVRFDDVFQVKAMTEKVRVAVDPYDLSALMDASQGLVRDLGALGRGGLYALEGRPSEDLGEYLHNAVTSARVIRTRDMSLGYAPTFKLLDWEEMNHNLFNALKMQKVVLTIFFS